MTVEVIRADSERLRRDFVHFPRRVYRGDPNWVPPLEADELALVTGRHPFWEYGQVVPFLALSAGRPVGRVAAIRNDLHNRYHGRRDAFFGFFEAVDSVEVARALLGAVEAQARQWGFDTVYGPVSPSMNDLAGWVVEGAGMPTFLMPYNPPYYPRLAEACGYIKAMDLYAYLASRADLENPRWSRLVQAAERLAERGRIRLRRVDMGRLEAEIRAFALEVYPAAWGQNWGFQPITEAELKHMARSLRPVLVPDLILFAEKIPENPDGGPPEVVGVLIAVPDYNPVLKRLNGRLTPWGLVRFIWEVKVRRSLKRTRVIAFGVKPAYQQTGVAVLMVHRVVQNALRLGFEEMEVSWVLETNRAMRNIVENFGLKPYRKYRIFVRKLGPDGG